MEPIQCICSVPACAPSRPRARHPTPINIGLLQEFQISAKSTVKELFGQYRDPLAIGAGTRKWTGKAKVARFSAHVLNAIYFGGSITTTGNTTTAYEADSGAGDVDSTRSRSTNSATWTVDQGVVYAATGLPLTRVSSVAAAGQYSVSAGVYTFDSGDASAAVIIAYNYTTTSAGNRMIVPQALIGPSLTFSINFTGVDPSE